MSSETEIASNALSKIGASPITSISDDTSTGAVLCRAYYYNTRDAVLRAYPWNCAIVRTSLAADTTAPTWKYAYKFLLPVNPYCLRLLEVEGNPEYKIAGRYIETDESSINIKYIKRISDTGLFDALLQEAIECRLAAELAFPITGNSALINAMWSLYGEKLREARTTDGMEVEQDSWESNALTECR